MIVEHLEVIDFRNYTSGSFDLTSGTTVVVGDNGQGKTNLVEALGYLATLSSFRGAPNDAMVRMGADTAVIRARVRHDDDREILVEAEIAIAGRNRVQVNRQRLVRSRDLLGTLRITVFSPRCIGNVLQRRSILRPSSNTWMRPSCGRRRSLMSIAAMILMRLVTALSSDSGTSNDL